MGPYPLLCWREGEHWLVACKHFDIVAQGPTKEEAFNRFCKVFTATVLDRTTEDGGIVDMPVPPPDVVEEWERKARLELH